MIKNVDEIVKMTLEANQRITAERHDRTMDYINNTIAREIEKTAKAGNVSVKFKVSESLDRDTIKRVLAAAGYEVKIKGYEVSISWLCKWITAAAEKGA